MAIGLSVIGALTIVWLSTRRSAGLRAANRGAVAIMALTTVALAGFEQRWQVLQGR
jgi:hypothetical protein